MSASPLPEVLPPAFGLVTCRQRRPPQCKTMVFSAVAVQYSPTAQISDGETAVTAFRTLPCVPPGLGLATCCHARPFQRIINARSVLPEVYSPTAQARDTDVAATPARSSLAACPPGSGVLTASQALPFQCSICGCQFAPFQNWPTAHALDRDVAATASSSLSAPGPAGFGLATSRQWLPFQCAFRVCS